MNDIFIFGVGLAVTLITGIGVVTSQVFAGYKKPNYSYQEAEIYVDPINKPV